MDDQLWIRRWISKQIKIEMLRQDKNQCELGQILEISAPQVSARMTGKIDFRVGELFKIADWLIVPVERLIPPSYASPRRSGSRAVSVA
jgi:transcriptional regulator with XRE-family HTH domain